MYTYLKERTHYEDRYDDVTVSICRMKEKIVEDAYQSLKAKGLPKLTGEDKDKDPERELIKVHNWTYYFEVEWVAGERWQQRDDKIQKMMNEDAGKDEQLAEARLTKEPLCVHCRKTGLRIISKDLMHRSRFRDKDKEQVLFMLDCPACEKRSAYWEDGTVWEGAQNPCPKCQTNMEHTSTQRAKVLTTTYTCPSCMHSYKDRYELGKYSKDEKPDPDYEKDKARFCFDEEAGKKYLDGRHNLESLRDVLAEMRERSDNKPVYDAVEELKKPKIAELSEILSPAMTKAGFSEFSLDKPEMGRDVFIGFNCLDTKADRDDHSSRKTLKQIVDKALKDTNWRLATDGISYRLGYLTGRLHAYEREDDLKKLVLQNKGLKYRKPSSSNSYDPDNSWRIKGKDGKDIIL
jgi:hypothetical protein